MSVVETEFMALVLILGVFWKYLVSYLVHTVALIQLRERLSEKRVGSPRIDLSHPAQPPTHIYTRAHILWCEFDLKKKKIYISGNIIINFSSYRNDYSCLSALCWNSWYIHIASTYKDELMQEVRNLILPARRRMCRSPACKIRNKTELSIKCSGQVLI